MTWLLVAVLISGPVEAASADSHIVLVTLPLRSALLAANLWALRTDRLGPVGSGRLFLAQAVITTTAWSLLLGSTPAELAFESAAYGTILSIFALLIAPSDQRRWWALAVVAIVLIPAGEGLLAQDPLLFVQLVTVLTVHGLALTTLDVHANRVETESQMASLDPLTGLFNRRPTLKRLTEQVVGASSGHATASALMLDLDHFKDLNDTLGHEAGDDALRDVAEVLTTLVRRDDVVCRWGGEEFLVLLPGVDEPTAAERAEAFRSGIARTGVTASVGLAEVRAGDTVAAWVARADAAMYEAKQQGRDRVATAPFVGATPDVAPCPERPSRAHTRPSTPLTAHPVV